MSYSIQVRAANKQAAKEALENEFDKSVVAYQPIHARDRAVVLANANAVIDLLTDDDSKDVHVSCNGYVYAPIFTENPADATLSTVSAAVQAAYVSRE